MGCGNRWPVVKPCALVATKALMPIRLLPRRENGWWRPRPIPIGPSQITWCDSICKPGASFALTCRLPISSIPVVFLPLHGKVLLRRAKDDYGSSSSKSVAPDHPQYYLLDAATGETKLVSGEFAPLRQEGKRFLQPTHESEEFWAAIPNREKNQTQVGRYNLKSFSFEPLLLIPHITFDSTAMWVDEAGAKLYVVYESNLLRLPVPTG